MTAPVASMNQIKLSSYTCTALKQLDFMLPVSSSLSKSQFCQKVLNLVAVMKFGLTTVKLSYSLRVKKYSTENNTATDKKKWHELRPSRRASLIGE